MVVVSGFEEIPAKVAVYHVYLRHGTSVYW